MSTRRWHIPLLFVATVFLAGCLPSVPYSSAGMSQASGNIEISLGCERESITRVIVTGYSHDDISSLSKDDASWEWEIESTSPNGSSLSLFTVGVVPEGFSEVKPYVEASWEYMRFEPYVYDDDRSSNERVPYYETGQWFAFQGHNGWAHDDSGAVDVSWEEYQNWQGVVDSCHQATSSSLRLGMAVAALGTLIAAPFAILYESRRRKRDKSGSHA